MTEDQRNSLCQGMTYHGFDKIEISDTEVRCHCTIETYEISLICRLSDCFPFELPTVFISEESYNCIAPLPHVSSDLSICTFDRTICIPNFLFPVQIILDSFCQARTTIYQGITKENSQDFFSEIEAYWNIECDYLAESIVSPTGTIKSVQLYCGKNILYLADSKKELDLFLSNIGIKKRFQKYYYDCLYLPLSIKIYPPFPKSNIELFKLLCSDSTISEVYRKYAQKHISNGFFVLTSTPNAGARCFQLWHHSSVTTNIPGFRKGHIPVQMAYLLDNHPKSIMKFSVINMAQDRLFFRGGEGLHTNVSKCAIIGCGSVGSYIIEALAEYGVSHFVLNDNDKLTAENIARHFCGYDSIGKSKISAISDQLTKHNPNISTTLFNEDGILFVDSHEIILNDCDFIIVATAYTPLEYKIIEKVNSSNITKPVIVVWVEPHLAAGHAIILQKPQDIFSEYFDSDFSFKDKVLKNSSDFSKKESGCQSTFIPYSAFHLKRFIYSFLEFLMNLFAQRKQGNFIFTWCGNLSTIKTLGGILEAKWADADNFSAHITRID